MESYKRSLYYAQEMDAKDPLKQFRALYNIPVNKSGVAQIYFCGNSLGLAPKNVSQCTAIIIPAMEKDRNAFRESEISIFFHLIYKNIKIEAIPIRNHTKGTESILIRAPSTAVNPHINTMR